MALVSYFAGGPLADRFAARRLMSVALATTALGGLVLVRIPSFQVLIVLYGLWGVTTILLFWAALIRATRELGGSVAQGRAFGLLEGGRGLLSALLASFSVALFANLLPTEVAAATLAQRSAALVEIIWIFISIVLGAAVLVWFAVPETKPTGEAGSAPRLTWYGVRSVMRMPAVWLQAAIFICVYVFNKSLDIFSLYARDALGYDDVAAAQITTIAFWVRPLAAIGAGVLADRIKASRMIVLSFCVLIVGSLTIASGTIKPGLHWQVVATVAGTSAGLFAVRGVFFALFQEARVPLAITGSAVGLVSVLGYTPDLFMPLLIGYLIDRTPGALGHQHVFGMLAAFATVGLTVTLLFQRVTRLNRVV
ncbi:MAG: MFS transporter [Acidobacteria bacterium]|nr:MFS transporter [Acidobacteriota bacterium]